MRRRKETAAAAAAYALLTLVFTWPIARGLVRDVPADFGDPLLNCWVLAWDADHMLRAITGHVEVLGAYWNANIFYPHPLALAFSEHLTPQALSILPFYAATKNPILCYNLVFLSTFLLSACGMFLLVRDLTASSPAAFLAGVAYGFAPYRFSTLSHVQVLSSMWMPFAWLGFRRFFDTRRVAPLVFGATAWIAQNLSCGYYLLFFSPVMALYLVWELTRRRLWTNTRVVVPIAAATCGVIAATVPFLLPYAELRRLGFSARSLGETGRFSADVYNYFTADIGMALWGRAMRAWPTSEGSLFPGLTIVTLGLVASIERWRHARGEAAAIRASWPASVLTWSVTIAGGLAIALLVGWTLRTRVFDFEIKITSLYRMASIVTGLLAALLATSRRARVTARCWFASEVGFLIILTVFAIAMSFGPEIRSQGKLIEDANIYAAFYHLVPGFDGLRVPARFAMIMALGLSGLAGCGAAEIARRRHGGPLVLAAIALIIAESWAVPIPVNLNSTVYKQAGLAALPPTLQWGVAAPPVYGFIAQLPAESALLEMPFGEVAFEARYMFQSIFHWRRLVNGYSGGSPRAYGLWAERLEDVLDQPEPAWQAVLDSRATHVVVHESSYAGDRGERISEWARVHGARELAAFDGDHVFSIPAPRR